MSKHTGPEVLTKRDLTEEIAKVAYSLYKERGMGNGYDFDDWLKAEKIVMEEFGRLKRNEIDLMSEAANKKTAGKVAKKRKKT